MSDGLRHRELHEPRRTTSGGAAGGVSAGGGGHSSRDNTPPHSRSPPPHGHASPLTPNAAHSAVFSVAIPGAAGGGSNGTGGGAADGSSADDNKGAGSSASATSTLVANFAAESSLPLHQSALIALAYTVGSTVFFLMIRYSKMLEKKSGEKVYDNAAAVFYMELVKWCFSVSAMYYRTGKFLPVSVFRDGTWRIGLGFAVPSLIYAVYNNMTYFNLTTFDPASFQVFMQTRVLFTGLLYSAIFHKALTRQKWLALILLTVGVASKYLDWNMTIDARILFLLFQASLSSFAGVYNEFLLKKDVNMDVNEQNFYMYTFALFFNLGFGLATNPDYYTSGRVVSSVNSWFVATVVCGAMTGIAASLVLKFINVIVKAFASATEVLITAVLAALFLGEALTIKDCVACCIVMVAIYMYYHPEPIAAVGGGGGGGGGGAAVKAEMSPLMIGGGNPAMSGSEKSCAWID